MHPHAGVEGFRIAAVIDPLMMDRWTVWSSVSPSGHPRPFKPRRFACKMRPDLHTICIRLADQTCFFRRLPPPPPQWIPAQGANFVADFIRFRRNFIRIPAEFHPDSDGISSGFGKIHPDSGEIHPDSGGISSARFRSRQSELSLVSFSPICGQTLDPGPLRLGRTLIRPFRAPSIGIHLHIVSLRASHCPANKCRATGS